MKIVKPSVELIWITPNAAQVIEHAGRICYKSEEKMGDGTSESFVAMLKKRGHLSVIEHASASLKFICDRGVTHEMVRHRIASYSQESTRYCNYGNDRFGREITFIEPPFENAEQRETWARAMEETEMVYMSLLDQGATPQMARSVLPNSQKTEIMMTANFREWIHFFDLRCAKASHPQMREVAHKALEILQREAPEVFAS